MSIKATSIAEVVVGSTLIGITMTTSAAPLGGLAVLPLIGIVPILFGIYGVDTPVCTAVSKAYHRAHDRVVATIEKIKHSSAHTA